MLGSVAGWILACAAVVALVFGVIALNADQQVRTLNLTAQSALVAADVQIVLLTITLSAVAVPIAGFVQRYRRRGATWAKHRPSAPGTMIVVASPEPEPVDITERMLAWAATGPPSRPDDVSVVFHGETGRRASTEDLMKYIAQVEDDIANDVHERDWNVWVIEMRRRSN